MNHRASASTDRSPKGLSALSDGRSLARSPPKTQGEPPARWPSYAVTLANYEAETATKEPKWPPLETATEESKLLSTNRNTDENYQRSRNCDPAHDDADDQDASANATSSSLTDSGQQLADDRTVPPADISYHMSMVQV